MEAASGPLRAKGKDEVRMTGGGDLAPSPSFGVGSPAEFSSEHFTLLGSRRGWPQNQRERNCMERVPLDQRCLHPRAGLAKAGKLGREKYLPICVSRGGDGGRGREDIMSSRLPPDGQGRNISKQANKQR